MNGGVRGTIGLGLWVALSVGCGPLIELSDDGAAASETGQVEMTTGVPTPTTANPPPPNTSTTTSPTSSPPPPPPDDSTSSMSGVSFLDDGFGDGGGVTFECDLFEQDCPRGEKCMPWANDGGGAWNATRCSPIAENPGAPGEPCTVEGSAVSGIDSCELGAMCWAVDSTTLQGVCVAMCIGSPAEPTCEDPDSTCTINGEGSIIVCLPTCDPLGSDCQPGQVCVPQQDDFQCVPDASGPMGAAGDPCEFINVCDPGLGCFPAELTPGCLGGAGCCTAYCNIGDAMPPCQDGQQCLPYYTPGSAPDGLEDLGVCGVP